MKLFVNLYVQIEINLIADKSQLNCIQTHCIIDNHLDLFHLAPCVHIN